MKITVTQEAITEALAELDYDDVESILLAVDDMQQDTVFTDMLRDAFISRSNAYKRMRPGATLSFHKVMFNADEVLDMIADLEIEKNLDEFQRGILAQLEIKFVAEAEKRSRQ